VLHLEATPRAGAAKRVPVVAVLDRDRAADRVSPNHFPGRRERMGGPHRRHGRAEWRIRRQLPASAYTLKRSTIRQQRAST
jgi:hypothetical protein